MSLSRDTPRVALYFPRPFLRILLIKAVYMGEKEDSGKIFTLRNPVLVSKVEHLKTLIKAQLSDDLVEILTLYVLTTKLLVSEVQKTLET